MAKLIVVTTAPVEQPKQKEKKTKASASNTYRSSGRYDINKERKRVRHLRRINRFLRRRFAGLNTAEQRRWLARHPGASLADKARVDTRSRQALPRRV
jgi:hypothetical protein